MLTKTKITGLPYAKRTFAALTRECEEFMKKLGITTTEIIHNPSVGQLYEYSMRPEHVASVDPSIFPTTISDSGALNCSSGLRTGRSPKDKRIVCDDETRDLVNWGQVNIPIEPDAYQLNR